MLTISDWQYHYHHHNEIISSNDNGIHDYDDTNLITMT
jgi:hypothetical protein